MAKISILPPEDPNVPNKIVKGDLHQANAPIQQAVEQANYSIDRTIDRRDSLLQKLFPNAATREIVKGELALVKTEFEFRIKALEKVRETQLQSLTEVCNQYLVRQKGQIRSTTAQFLMQKTLELQKEVDRIVDEFIAFMEIQMEKVQTIKNPLLRQKRENQLERDIDGFMRQQAAVIDNFRRIIDEGV